MSKLQKALEEKLGPGRARLASRGLSSTVREVIPTGIAVVDHYVIGRGGIPVGKLTELFSESESQGKTSLALSVAAQAQRMGSQVVWIETEDALEEERCDVLGVDRSRLIVAEPSHLDDLREAIDVVLSSLPKYVPQLSPEDDAAARLGAEPPTLVVIDSLAATPTKAEHATGVGAGKGQPGDRARSMSAVCRVLARRAQDQRLAVLLINQSRWKIGVTRGEKKTTPGGEAVKFHSHLRLKMLGGAAVKSSDEVLVGRDFTVKAVKNRMAPPHRECAARLKFATGWDEAWSVLWHGKEHAIVGKRTSGRDAIRKVWDEMKWPTDPAAFERLGIAEPQADAAPKAARKRAKK